MPVQFETKFINKNLPKDRKIAYLIKWGKRFKELGIAPKTLGNLSFRTKSGFIITGTGTKLGELRPEDLVEVLEIKKENDKFTVYCRGKIIPSMETIFHNEIYKIRPEINAIFHLHDRLVLEKGDKLKIPCTEREQPPGSYLLAEEIKKILKERKGINYLLLKNHGVVSLGRNLAESRKLLILFHEKARRVL